MKIQGSVAFITGAAKRVGKTILLELAQRGAHIILHYRQSAREASALQKKVQAQFGVRVHLLAGNLSEHQEIKRLAETAWGFEKKIDILINNASTFYPTPLGQVEESQWDDLFNVNAKAPFFLCESIGLKMKKRGRGKIINIGDWSALSPYTNYLPYCASKAALVCLSQGLAKTLAPQVQVNTIMPGPVMWPEDLSDKIKNSVIAQTPLKKIGTPQDVAAAVRFFIESGDFSTGSLLHVDGGRHIV